MKYRVTDIAWDVDDPKDFENLPQDVTIVLTEDDDEDVDLVLSDILSDQFGFCHNGFNYRRIG